MRKQLRLPGQPGPSQQSIERRLKIIDTLDQLDRILAPTLENLPNGSKLTIKQKIRGDLFQITISPADAEEEPK